LRDWNTRISPEISRVSSIITSTIITIIVPRATVARVCTIVAGISITGTISSVISGICRVARVAASTVRDAFGRGNSLDIKLGITQDTGRHGRVDERSIRIG
jgi:hypothetical protein